MPTYMSLSGLGHSSIPKHEKVNELEQTESGRMGERLSVSARGQLLLGYGVIAFICFHLPIH